MSLRRKPHTITLIPVSDSYTGGRVDVPTEGTQRTFKGQVTPMTADQAFRTFASDLEVKRPHLLLCDVGDASGIKVSDRILFNSERYYVSAGPMIWQAGESTDCAQILLELEQRQ